ncbi:MAG: rRNA maturation RNase YbeY [Candidatus Eremiobacteraeota bacterium]|nr:rRNA maturation RNase YbeY [Candidatus Eremiobacteraeota bacterium]
MIHFRSAARKTGVDGRLLKRTARTLLKAVGEERSALSLSLVSDRTIRSLNRAHRGNDKPTDVLSFPLAAVDDPVPHERLLGDVVISVDTARRQAADYDAGIQDEVHRLLIHGILHVLGHDHEKARERVRMEAEERRLAAIIGMRWPY